MGSATPQNQGPIGELCASGKVTAAGALSGNPFNVASVAIAASVYTITLTDDGSIDLTDATLSVTPATDKQFVTAAQTGDKTIVVKGWDAAGAAADTAFSFELKRSSGPH
jgi:hypothetical protein